MFGVRDDIFWQQREVAALTVVITDRPQGFALRQLPLCRVFDSSRALAQAVARDDNSDDGEAAKHVAHCAAVSPKPTKQLHDGL